MSTPEKRRQYSIFIAKACNEKDTITFPEGITREDAEEMVLDLAYRYWQAFPEQNNENPILDTLYVLFVEHYKKYEIIEKHRCDKT